MKFRHVEILAERCRNCGICIRVCPNKAIIRNGDKCVIDTTKCNDCKKCIEKCPVFAIKWKFSWRNFFKL